MRGITADEGAAVAEAVGDEPSADKVFLRDHLVGKVRTDAEDLADRPIAIDQVIFAAIEVIVNDPGLAAIDRDGAAAAAWIERKIDPRAFPGSRSSNPGALM